MVSFAHNAAGSARGAFCNASIVQPSSVNAMKEMFGGDHPAIMQGIVLTVHYPDDMENVSAIKRMSSNGLIRPTEEEIRKIIDNEQLIEFIGYRIECDVLITFSTTGSLLGFIISNVPIVKKGGIHDFECWVPSGCTNWDGTDQNVDLSKLDGDHVLVGFVGHNFPFGAIVLGQIDHPLNYEDNPRSLLGTFGAPKRIDDSNRKDGKVFISRCSGTFKKIDRTGNVLLDTTQAARREVVDNNTGSLKLYQDITRYDENQNTITPGGGDIDVRVKNQRKIKISFCNNQKVADKSKYPPEFEETGSLLITNDSEDKRIDVNGISSLYIKVQKSGGDGKFQIETEDTKATIILVDGKIQIEANDGKDTIRLQNGKVEIDTEAGVAAILLGKDNIEQLVTKSFVEKIFCAHNHGYLNGIEPSFTDPPSVLEIPVVGSTIDDTTGALSSVLLLGKIATTKTKAE